MNPNETRVLAKVLRLDGIATNGKQMEWPKSIKVGDVIDLQGAGSRKDVQRPHISGLEKVNKGGKT